MNNSLSEYHSPAHIRWKYTLPVVSVVVILILAIFHETAWSTVTIWLYSDTYAHGFLILPIVAWLIWDRRDHLAQILPTPDFLAGIPLALAGFVWLAGRLGDAQVVQQFGLVAMLISGVWMIIGATAAKQLAFPLAFLFFAVPMGKDLVPLLMEFTASFTVELLRLTGVPVFREGLYFSLPSGNWSVVEACSGIRYLIASITLGCLYAYLTYRSLWRRTLFIAASIFVPILANGLRAYIIVMLGHLSGMKLAVGVDHLIYGWVFFGLVMLLLFFVGAIWREPREPLKKSQGVLVDSKSEKATGSTIRVGVSALAVVIIWPLAAYAMELRVTDSRVDLQAPVARLGWIGLEDVDWGWQPLLPVSTYMLDRYYTKNETEIGLFVRQFLSQQQGRELIGFRDFLVKEKDPDWKIVSQSKRNISIGTREIPVIQVKLKGREGELLIWYWYRIGNHVTTNRYIGKLLEVISRLTFGRTDATFLAVATRLDKSEVSEQQALEYFLADMLQPVELAIDQVVGEE